MQFDDIRNHQITYSKTHKKSINLYYCIMKANKKGNCMNSIGLVHKMNTNNSIDT